MTLLIIAQKSPTFFLKSPAFHHKSPIFAQQPYFSAKEPSAFFLRAPYTLLRKSRALLREGLSWEKAGLFWEKGSFERMQGSLFSKEPCILSQSTLYAVSKQPCILSQRSTAFSHKSPTFAQKSPALHRKSPIFAQKPYCGGKRALHSFSKRPIRFSENVGLFWGKGSFERIQGSFLSREPCILFFLRAPYTLFHSYVTWLIRMCDTAHLYVMWRLIHMWHDVLFIRDASFVCDMTRSYMGHDSFICDMMPYSYVMSPYSLLREYRALLREGLFWENAGLFSLKEPCILSQSALHTFQRI